MSTFYFFIEIVDASTRYLFLFFVPFYCQYIYASYFSFQFIIFILQILRIAAATPPIILIMTYIGRLAWETALFINTKHVDPMITTVTTLYSIINLTLQCFRMARPPSDYGSSTPNLPGNIYEMDFFGAYKDKSQEDMPLQEVDRLIKEMEKVLNERLI